MDFSGFLGSIKNIANSYQNVGGEHYNAILYIPIGSGEAIENELGVWEMTETELKLFLRLSEKKDPANYENKGTGQLNTYIEGLAITPNEWKGILPSIIRCEILQQEQITLGNLRVTDCIPCPLSEATLIHKALGQRIKGYFQRTEADRI